MCTVNFSEKKETKFQVSVIKMLENYKFTFIPINEYSNEHFYCSVLAPKHPNMSNWGRRISKFLGLHDPDEEMVEFTLSMTMYNNYDVVERIPMVFTQKDVKLIITDLPDNYVGPDVL